MCKQKKNKKKLTQIAQITLFHTFLPPLNMSKSYDIVIYESQMTAQRVSYGCTTRGGHVHNS